MKMKSGLIQLSIFIAMLLGSYAFADDAATPTKTGDDPWSKTYVFQFEHDTFYVPAVWVADSPYTIPKLHQLPKPPDGSIFKVKGYLILGPLAPDWNMGSRLTFEQAQAMESPRLVAGRSFLVSQIVLHTNYYEPSSMAQCPTYVWESAHSVGYFEGNECSINCYAQAYGKKDIVISPRSSFCNAQHATHLGYRVEYNWDGRYVDPTKWEDQDRLVEQLLDWLKTPPSQRPKYLPDLSPKDKP